MKPLFRLININRLFFNDRRDLEERFQMNDSVSISRRPRVECLSEEGRITSTPWRDFNKTSEKSLDSIGTIINSASPKRRFVR